DDVWMIKISENMHFSHEKLFRLFLVFATDEVITQFFDDGGFLLFAKRREVQIPRHVHGAHAALTEAIDYLPATTKHKWKFLTGIAVSTTIIERWTHRKNRNRQPKLH